MPSDRSHKKPEVTVLIPARNAETTLAETLESLLGQTYSGFEVVLVEDGSTDHTRKVAEAFQNRFAEKNGNERALRVVGGPARGIPAARNTGLDHVETEFFANLDADDISKPLRLELQLAALKENPNWVLCASEADEIDERGVVTGTLSCPKTPEAVREAMYQKCCLHHSSVMFRRDAVVKAGKYRDLFPVAEDYDLYLRLLGLGELGVLPQQLVQYRRHDTQTTHGKNLKQRLVADLALLCAFARKRGESEPVFSLDQAGAVACMSLKREFEQSALSNLKPKIARQMVRRIKAAGEEITPLKRFLILQNAKALRLGELLKCLSL